jgi:hypothetical protein
MNIIELIPFDHYVTRQELVAKTGYSDRKIRNEIHRLRTDSPETLIISDSRHCGYKRPSTYDELTACRAESVSRLKAELKKIEAIDVVLNNRDQMGLGLIV